MKRRIPNHVTKPMPRRKDRGRVVMLMGATVTSALAATPALAASQVPSSAPAMRASGAAVQFAIAAGPLAVVLAEFERLTGLKAVLAMPELAVIQSPGVPPSRRSTTRTTVSS